ncbi:MAG: HU family DNA-binding protein, partial [Clostridia bacterium]|nr:HU family DNA-binding protein [Clostridia bacterium]
MNKKTVIKLLAKNANLPKNNIERVLNAFESLMLDALRKGEIINFSGFAKLYTRQRNERTFVN